MVRGVSEVGPHTYAAELWKRPVVLRSGESGGAQRRIIGAEVNRKRVVFPVFNQGNPSRSLIGEIDQVVGLQGALDADIPIHRIRVAKVGVVQLRVTRAVVRTDERRCAIGEDIERRLRWDLADPINGTRIAG